MQDTAVLSRLFSNTLSPKPDSSYWLLGGAVCVTDDTAVSEKPSRPRWSYRFTLWDCVLSLEGARQNWAFSQLETMVRHRLRAANGGGCLCNEHPSRAKKKARQTWDIWNTTGLIHSCANLGWKSTLICSSPPSDAYKSNVSYHQEASDHRLIVILLLLLLRSHTERVAAPCNLKTSSWKFNSYQK